MQSIGSNGTPKLKIYLGRRNNGKKNRWAQGISVCATLRKNPTENSKKKKEKTDQIIVADAVSVQIQREKIK